MGATLHSMFVWAIFRMIRKYLVCGPEGIRRIDLMLDYFGDGCKGHGPIHLLVIGA